MEQEVMAIETEILRRAADRLVEYPFEVWRTGDAVALEGLLALSRLLDEPQWAAWVHGFLKAWSARSQPFRESDDTAAGRAICMTFEQTADPSILRSAVALGEDFMARRAIDGACVFRETTPLRRPYPPAALEPGDELLLEDPG